MKRKLGLNPSAHDSRTLLFSDYRVKGATITLPPSFGVPDGFVPQDGWGMLANGPDPTVDPNFEGAGDCFFAGRAHGTWAAIMRGKQTALMNPFTSKDVLASYSHATGYRPSDDPNNPTDRGTDPITGLNYCRKTGIASSNGGVAVHKLGAYMAIEPGNWTEILESAFLFGSAGLGFQIPDYAEAEFEARRKWSVRSGGEIEGGHWVEAVTYDHVRGLELVTWGSRIQVTKGFVSKFCNAPYALLTPEILDPVSGKSHEGFDLAQLRADLAVL